jgi:hypothetical protein
MTVNAFAAASLGEQVTTTSHQNGVGSETRVYCRMAHDPASTLQSVPYKFPVANTIHSGKDAGQVD